MKSKSLLKAATSGLILLSSFNDIYAEEDRKVLNLDPFRVEVVGNKMGDADSEKIFRYAEYLYENKRYTDALPYLENIRQYSRSDIVDDAVYLLANIHLKKIHDSRDSFDYALTLFEQMIFTHPEGNIVNDGYVKGSLENIINFCVEHSDYPHATWAFGILTNYPGISERDIKSNETIVRNFLKKELLDNSLLERDIPLQRTYQGYIKARDDPDPYAYGGGFIPTPEYLIFKRYATEFGLFKSRKMIDLIDKLKQIDTKSDEFYKCPIRGENFYEIGPPFQYYNGREVVYKQIIKMGYPNGTSLEHFLKDIGIEDPMKWWESLE